MNTLVIVIFGIGVLAVIGSWVATYQLILRGYPTSGTVITPTHALGADRTLVDTSA